MISSWYTHVSHDLELIEALCLVVETSVQRHVARRLPDGEQILWCLKTKEVEF